jgi:hypothetical protein
MLKKLELQQDTILADLNWLGERFTNNGASEIQKEIQQEIEWSMNIIEGKYDYLNHPKKEWYPGINYSKTALYEGKYEYNHFMTIKIRKAYEKHYKSQGYPLSSFHKIDFDSGVSLWIPNFYDIAFTKTMELWLDDLSQAWRYVYIVYSGSPRIKSLLALIPWFDVDTALKYFFYQNPVKYNIWDNLAFFNTAHDNLILANWDRIRRELETFM